MANEYGRRLLPAILRQKAKDNPEGIFAIHARSGIDHDDFVQISNQQALQVANSIANWLQLRFASDDPSHGFQTIAFIGVPDVRYNFFFYAGVQCQYKVFLPSPRNTLEVNQSLFVQTQCFKLVYTTEVASVAYEIQASVKGVQCEQLASLEELLAAPTSDFSYDLKYADVYRDAVLVLHSSGSTGLPKPVTHTHGTIATFDVRDWPDVPGRKNHDTMGTLRFNKGRVYDVFPPFHLAGFLIKILVPLFNDTAPIFGPSSRPPSGALAADLIRRHKPQAVVLPPSIAEQLYHEPDAVQILEQVDVFGFAGGPLPQDVGDQISRYTTLCQLYGSTEIGQIRQLIPHPEHWAYLQFHPSEAYELQPAGDGTFELVLFVDETMERTSSLFHSFPGVREWRTNDLFVPHPSEPDLWKFHARRDDIVVLSSGEKVNPIPMESHITAAAATVRGALVVGQGRPHVALLLELSRDEAPVSNPQDILWPIVEQVNAQSPPWGRISKSMILVAAAEKPFTRAGKGSIVRRFTEEAYCNEIEQLYKNSILANKPTTHVFAPSTFSKASVERLVRSILDQIMIRPKVDVQDNLFLAGLDSIKSLELVAQIRASLRPHRAAVDLQWLSLDIVYRNPTVNHLVNVLLEYLNKGIVPTGRNRQAEIAATVQKLVQDLPSRIVPPKSKERGEALTVAITGTTGNFGSHLACELVKCKSVAHVVCLNRSPTAVAQAKFHKRYAGPCQKATFLQVDMAAPRLGLDDAEYTKLQSVCDAVVHNAWRVDFNYPLNSFTDNLASVQRMVALSHGSGRRPRIVFVSSISATGVWAAHGSARQTVPCAIIHDPQRPMDVGYAESKYVAEVVLHAAAERAGIPVTVLRLGQLAPSARPEDAESWPTGDILSVYLQTCRALGAISHDLLERVDWVPVDGAAKVVAELVQSAATQSDMPEPVVYNVVHPQPTAAWQDMLASVQTWCGSQLLMLSTRDWVKRLRDKEQQGGTELATFPALRMLKVYELISNRGPMHAYDMSNVRHASPSIDHVQAADGDLMRMWINRI